MNIKINFESCRSFFPWGYHNNYHLVTAIDLAQSLKIAREWVSTVMPQLGRPQGEILDIKGCGPCCQSDSEFPNLHPEQLLFLSASLPANGEEEDSERADLTDDSSAEANEQAEKLSHFQWALITEYSDMPKGGHIRHKVKSRQQTSAAQNIFISDLLAIPQIKLEYFWIGCELFYPNFFSSSLGLAPLAREKFCLQLGAEKLELLIDSSGLASCSSLPLQKDNLFDRISDLLTAVVQFSLKADYLERACA